MSFSENKYIRSAERQLVNFGSYSFDNYCRLMLILVNNMHFLENNVPVIFRHDKASLKLEIERRIFLLHASLSDPNKHENFKSHVAAALTLTQKIDAYLPAVSLESRSQRLNIFAFIKRLFFSDLRHI